MDNSAMETGAVGSKGEEGRTMVGWRDVQVWSIEGGEVTGRDLIAALVEYRQTGGIGDRVLADPEGASTPEEFEELCVAGPSRDEIDWTGLPEGLRFSLRDDTESWTVYAGSAEEAAEEACDAAEEASEGLTETSHYEVTAREICPWCGGEGRHARGCSQEHTYDLEEATESRAIDPEEPDCSEASEHVWGSPHEIVGGLRGHGGEVCVLCGLCRETDTQGVSYDDDRYARAVSDWHDEIRDDAARDGAEAVDALLEAQGLDAPDTTAEAIEEAAKAYHWRRAARAAFAELDLHEAHEEIYVAAYVEGADDYVRKLAAQAEAEAGA